MCLHKNKIVLHECKANIKPYNTTGGSNSGSNNSKRPELKLETTPRQTNDDDDDVGISRALHCVYYLLCSSAHPLTPQFVSMMWPKGYKMRSSVGSQGETSIRGDIVVVDFLAITPSIRRDFFRPHQPTPSSVICDNKLSFYWSVVLAMVWLTCVCVTNGLLAGSQSTTRDEQNGCSS